MEGDLERQMYAGFIHIIDGTCLSMLVDETMQFEDIPKTHLEDAIEALKDLLLVLFHWRCVLAFYMWI